MPDDLDLGQTLRGFAAGQKLARRYALVRVLGRGGMGVVWQAHDEELGRDIAMKFLPEIFVHDHEAIADLKRETNRSLELTHPNIVRIHDFVPGDNWAGITMEYVDGDTLSALKVSQPGGTFDAAQIAPLIESLCATLAYAHEEARVVHRDLKPANLMRTKEGRLKVADFGIAGTLSESGSRISMRPTSSGTLVFMSPQQAMGGEPAATDDIYSLGATIYDLLTGKPPFYSGDILAQLREETPPSMSERRTRLGVTGKNPIPPEWEATVAACLAKDPAQRPSSAREVASRLGLAQAGPPKPPPVPGSNRAVLIATVALLLACAAAVWWFAAKRPQAAAPQPAPPQPEASPSATPGVTVANPSPSAAPAVTVANPFVNSLGMRFVPVPGTNVLFSVWETRVEDFRACAQATGYVQGGGMALVSVAPNEQGVYAKKLQLNLSASWQNPGFEQADDSPVVGVNWEEAIGFCTWLTQKEQAAGLIGPNQFYRLPTDQEWSAAVGAGKYPWGGQWPPPGAANYFDQAAVAALSAAVPHVPGNDGYAKTNPVGAFPPNRLGLYDIGGNVWQLCEDLYRSGMNTEALLDWAPLMKNDGGGVTYRVARGASWSDWTPELIASAVRIPVLPIYRGNDVGFRCVLAGGSTR